MYDHMVNQIFISTNLQLLPEGKLTAPALVPQGQPPSPPPTHASPNFCTIAAPAAYMMSAV